MAVVRRQRYQRAVQLIADRSANGWQAAIAELVELIPNTETDVLRECGALLLSSGDDEHSRIVFQKLGDYEQLLNLYVRKNNWEEAVQLVAAQPELDKHLVYAPFGTWLLTQDKFEEALDAYREAGQFRTVLQVLQVLTKNAIIECR
jgi:intraflagellar transport protein 122